MKIDELIPSFPPDVVTNFGHIFERLQGVELPTVTGWYILCLQYIRPEKSKGGLYYAEKTKQEDVWQGRVGLVLAVGPAAYADKSRYPEGPWTKVGDVIVWPKLENSGTKISYGDNSRDDVLLAVLNDDRIVLVGVDPLRAMG